MEQSDLGLHCLYMPFSQSLMFEVLGHLPYKYKWQFFSVENKKYVIHFLSVHIVLTHKVLVSNTDSSRHHSKIF